MSIRCLLGLHRRDGKVRDVDVDQTVVECSRCGKPCVKFDQ